MLNDTQIRTAKPKSKPYKLPREQGLFVLVSPQGKKLWRFSYLYGGREKQLSFGPYPAVGLAEARKRREAARGLLAGGNDPSQSRQAEMARKEFENENTFRTVADQWLAMREGTMTVSTHNKARWMLEFAHPYIGDRPLQTIQPPDVLKALRAIEQTGKLETMHRVKARISEVFRYAIATGRASTDPCRDLRGALKPKQPTRHFAALTDPKDVARLMRAIAGYSGTPEVHSALQLAPLLFVRPGELRAAQWPQFDLDSEAPAWRYIASKTGTQHIVPLSSQAISILRELYPLTGHGLEAKPDAPHYVFPGARTRLRPISENALTAALRTLGYSGDQVTAHGFRAMARTLLAEMGWTPDAIERQLAHKPSGPLGAAYDRAQHLQERRQMMQAWADYLFALRDERSVVAGRFGKAA